MSDHWEAWFSGLSAGLQSGGPGRYGITLETASVERDETTPEVGRLEYLTDGSGDYCEYEVTE